MDWLEFAHYYSCHLALHKGHNGHPVNKGFKSGWKRNRQADLLSVMMGAALCLHSRTALFECTS